MKFKTTPKWSGRTRGRRWTMRRLWQNPPPGVTAQERRTPGSSRKIAGWFNGVPLYGAGAVGLIQYGPQKGKKLVHGGVSK